MELYCWCVRGGHDTSQLTDRQREHLTLAIEKGWIARKNPGFAPRFPVLSAVQFYCLRELCEKGILQQADDIERFCQQVERLYRGHAPASLRSRAPQYAAIMTGWVWGLRLCELAEKQGLLTRPADEEACRIAQLLVVDR